jgi:hypothetical protein
MNLNLLSFCAITRIISTKIQLVARISLRPVGHAQGGLLAITWMVKVIAIGAVEWGELLIYLMIVMNGGRDEYTRCNQTGG